MNKILKTSSILILSLFLGAMFLSLFQMSFSTDMSHHGMEDCPFMSHSEILCSMNVTDHIEAWQSVFSSLINIFTFLILSSVGTLALPAFFLKKYNPFPPLYRKIRKHIYTYFYRPLQELFSNGILNPKLF